MSNRALLTIARQTIAAVDAQLQAAEQDVSSVAAELHVGRARAYLRAASEELGTALGHSTDPILDLTRGAAA